MSLGMFCSIPLPVHPWDDRCMGLMLPCLPLVGAAIGAIWWGLAELLACSGMHLMPAAAIVAVLPYALSGFLHLDGFMDTSDAVLSRRPLEEKLRILKEPHLGMFSAVMLGILFMLQFSAAYAVLDRGKSLPMLAVIPILSRCCGAASLLCLKPMPQSGYGNLFTQNTGAGHKFFVALVGAGAVAGAFLAAGAGGAIAAGCAILGYALAMAWSYVEFKGISGDLTGFSIMAGELSGLLAWGVL